METLMFQDRPYQSDAIAADIACYDTGVRRMMNVMATGTGKTVCFARLFEAMKSRLPGQMLVIAHTEELVEQNRKTMQNVNPNLKVGKEMAGEYADTESDIISGSVQTLGRKGTERIKRFNWERIDKVIIDEAHHATSDAYRRILDMAGSLSPTTDKLLLGTTATSQRSDGKALSEIFDKVAYTYSLRQAITDKWLVPIRGYRITTSTVLDSVESSNGDYRLSQLREAVDSPSRNKQIVHEWSKIARDRSTLCFTCDIEHAEHLAAAFREGGVNAEAIWGDDPKRVEKLHLHRTGEIRVLCNCSVLTEGYDDPEVACIVLARPTKSAVLFTQMVGRGTRLAEGKTNLIVIDVVDSTIDHSLVTMPTLMGLQNTLDLKGRDVLEVVEEIERMQEEHPSIDFTTLKDINELQAVVKAIDLFEVRFPAEVEANSDMIWFKAIGGGYKINIPKDGPERAGFMHIHQNVLGEWAIEGRIKDVNLAATRPTVEEAFKASDEQIRKRLGKMRLAYLLREATWHNKPVTKGQQQMLKRLFPHRQFPWPQMTSGMASKMIAERLRK
jgi:superfamily II DNA or RNA helicase